MWTSSSYQVGGGSERTLQVPPLAQPKAQSSQKKGKRKKPGSRAMAIIDSREGETREAQTGRKGEPWNKWGKAQGRRGPGRQ